MIYVTVGTLRMAAFDRLLREMDEIAKDLTEPVFAQIGPTDFTPCHMQSARYLPYVEAMRRIREAKLVVSHAGIGTTLLARCYGIRIVLLPRRARLGEHYNDHQMEIAEQLRGRPGVRVVVDQSQLRGAILALLAEPRPDTASFGKGLDGIETAIRAFLNMPPCAERKRPAG